MITLGRIVGAMGASVFVVVCVEVYGVARLALTGGLGILGIVWALGIFGPIVVASVIPLVAWRSERYRVPINRVLFIAAVPLFVTLPTFFFDAKVYFDLGRSYPFAVLLLFLICIVVPLSRLWISSALCVLVMLYIMYFGLGISLMARIAKKEVFDVWVPMAWIYLQFAAFSFIPESFRWFRNKINSVSFKT